MNQVTVVNDVTGAGHQDETKFFGEERVQSCFRQVAKSMPLVLLAIFWGLTPYLQADEVLKPGSRSSGIGRVKAVTKYKFDPSDGERSVGLGSGLALAVDSKRHKAGEGDAAFEFWVLSDRGPNIEGPWVAVGDKLRPSKIFPIPEYGPRLARIAVNRDVDGQHCLEILEELVLKDQHARPLGGLPPLDDRQRLPEVPLSTRFEIIKDARSGVDSEGVAMAVDGGFWIVDEYRPAVMYFSKRGKLKKMLTPENGLPSWLRLARPNRGLEGVAVMPDGSVVAALQSPRVDEDNHSLTYLDIVKISPDGKSLKEYRFDLPQEFAEDPEEFKLGDLVAVSNESVLATIAWNGQAYVERLHLGSEPSVSSERLLDLRALGWKKKKTEGLALLPNGKTIVIINDDDFEVAGEVSIDPASLILRSDGSLQTKGEVTFTLLDTKKKRGGSEMWFIELKDKV